MAAEPALESRPLAYSNVLTSARMQDNEVELHLTLLGRQKEQHLHFSDLESTNSKRLAYSELESRLRGYESLLRRVGRENEKLRQEVATLRQTVVEDPARVQLKIHRSRLETEIAQADARREKARVNELLRLMEELRNERDEARKAEAAANSKLADISFRARVTAARGPISNAVIDKLADIAAQDAE